MDIAGTIAAVSSGLKLISELRSINNEFDKAEIKAKLADVMSSMADAKMSLMEAQETLSVKDKEIERLKSAFQFRAELVEYRGFKYEPFEDGGPKGLPFCPTCEQNLGRLYRLAERENGTYDELFCPNCKTKFTATAFLWEKSHPVT